MGGFGTAELQEGNYVRNRIIAYSIRDGTGSVSCNSVFVL